MNILRPFVIAGSLLSLSPAFAAPVPVLNFPTPGLPYSATYGDFQSYSMPILDWASTSSGGPAYMFNTANTIQDALVIGTGAGGNQNNQDLGLNGAVQNGFDFPNLAGNGTGNYSTTTAVGGPTWNISLTALRDYLTFGGVQHDMVAYFNNNQRGQVSNNLWAWAQITLVGNGGPQTFTLNNVGSGSTSDFGVGDYVLNDGPVTLCYNMAFANATAANIVPCNGAEVDSHTFQHNLGQNDVSYAIFSELLNDLIWSNSYTEMQVRVDFQELNNGFENLFIGAACVGRDGCTTIQVPEPGSIALLGLGLLGLAVGRRSHKASRSH